MNLAEDMFTDNINKCLYAYYRGLVDYNINDIVDPMHDLKLTPSGQAYMPSAIRSLLQPTIICTFYFLYYYKDVLCTRNNSSSTPFLGTYSRTPSICVSI